MRLPWVEATINIHRRIASYSKTSQLMSIDWRQFLPATTFPGGLILLWGLVSHTERLLPGGLIPSLRFPKF